jgi:hypothetical protein
MCNGVRWRFGLLLVLTLFTVLVGPVGLVPVDDPLPLLAALCFDDTGTTAMHT